MTGEGLPVAFSQSNIRCRPRNSTRGKQQGVTSQLNPSAPLHCIPFDVIADEATPGQARFANTISAPGYGAKSFMAAGSGFGNLSLPARQ